MYPSIRFLKVTIKSSSQTAGNNVPDTRVPAQFYHFLASFLNIGIKGYLPNVGNHVPAKSVFTKCQKSRASKKGIYQKPEIACQRKALLSMSTHWEDSPLWRGP